MINCLILAAGEGTRLRPLTNDCPKALVSLLGEPLLKYQVDTLLALGINKIAVVTGYMSEKFESLGLQTFHNQLYGQTNMVNSLFSARAFLEQVKGDLLISYGDIVYEKKNLETVLATEGEVVVMVDDGWLDLWSARNENPITDAETLKYGTLGNIIELGKPPRSLADIDGQYTGLIKISRDKVAEILSFYDNLDSSALFDGRSFEQMYMTSFLQLMIDSGWMVMPARVSHGWLEVDTVEDLKLYERLSSEGRLETLWSVND